MKRNYSPKFAFFFITLFLCSLSLGAKNVLKVLAIGNSFSEDAVEQNLYELAQAQGDSLVIGNAYIPGCSIDRHWSDAQTNKAEYNYRKIIGGVKTNKKDQNLEQIIKDENWDIITLQQCSPQSGQYNTYTNIQNLMKYILEKTKNKKFRFMFHMTWAYAKNSNHSAFINYDRDQLKMYNCIINATKKVLKEQKIKTVIPDGTAIQNGRTIFGDILNRDGYHLSKTLGRYITACTWCEVLTGKNIIGNKYYPATLNSKEAAIAQKAARVAIKSPFRVTMIKN